MTKLTLSHKFSVGLIAVVIAALAVIAGTRLLGKAALFHYLEREHVTLVLRASNALDRVLAGGMGLEPSALTIPLKEARSIAIRVGTELTVVEKNAFILFGFGDVIQLPINDTQDLTKIISTIEAHQAPTITADLANDIKNEMSAVIENSTRFGPLVADAVNFVKAAVLAINLACISAVLWSFIVIRQATLTPLRKAIELAQRVASGNLLSSESGVYAEDEVGRLNKALDDMRINLARLVGDVRDQSGVVASSMIEVSESSKDLSRRADRQAFSLQRITTGMSKLNRSVLQNGDQVRNMDCVASHAKQLAVSGGSATAQVVIRMNDILAASRRIAEITSVIDAIAYQTNMLALNASVEAARAGEQGRGFSVVATEVGQLARRCADAAKEITLLITDSLAKVESGAVVVGEAGKTIDLLVDAVQNVSVVITHVTANISSQEEEIKQIDAAIKDLNESTHKNAAMAEQSAAVAEIVRTNSSALVSTVDHFKLA